MTDDPYVPTLEEAVQIAVDVESGHTRSYVWAASMLGRFVRHHEPGIRAVSSILMAMTSDEERGST